MKKYIFSLTTALVLSSLLVAGYGAHLKYNLLAPIGQYQDKSIIELPFLMIADDTLTYILAQEQLPEEITEPTQDSLPPQPTKVTQPPEEEPVESTKPPLPTDPPPVDISWFDDCLFIGNSLTVGLREFAELGNAEFFCDVGLTIFSARKNWVHDTSWNQVQLQHVLNREQFGKIYIALGINECGYDLDYFLSGYQDLLDYIRSCQPEATIIIHGLITTGRSKAQEASCWHPKNIYSYNDGLRELAERNENVLFIDFNPYIADSEGFLPEGWSWDGCHPNLEGYKQWGEWIVWNAAYLDIRNND